MEGKINRTLVRKKEKKRTRKIKEKKKRQGLSGKHNKRTQFLDKGEDGDFASLLSAFNT